jgi:hypothetical protein
MGTQNFNPVITSHVGLGSCFDYSTLFVKDDTLIDSSRICAVTGESRGVAKKSTLLIYGEKSLLRKKVPRISLEFCGFCDKYFVLIDVFFFGTCIESHA